MKLHLLVRTKSCAEIGRIEIETNAVPRVGEIVNLESLASSDLALGSVTTFFVDEVEWKLEGRKLIPHLTCHEWFEGDRRLELQSNGWL